MEMARYTAEIPWKGKSGRNYNYYVYKIGGALEGPGNFIFSRRSDDGRHQPIYIGQTGDLNLHLGPLGTMSRALAAGATHVCVRPQSDAATRAIEEDDLKKQHAAPIADLPRRW
jgi:hypothetical protein